MSSQTPGGGRGHEEPIPLHSAEPPAGGSRIRHSGEAAIPVEGLGDDSGGLIRTIGSSSAVAAGRDRDAAEAALRRPLVATGTGATRCRTFSCKLTDASLVHMDMMINEWLDGTKAEVKFCSTAVGRFEGKNAENKLILTVWY